MKPKRIILLRHGESSANVDPTVYARIPDHRIELTGAGIEQAADAGSKIADLIGDDAFGVFCSPYQRTIQTKNAMLKGVGRKPLFDHQDPSLREQEFGNMPTADSNEANREFRSRFGYFFYRFPNGESCADVYDRMALFLDSLYRRFDWSGCPENIVVVSHGTAIKCFLTRWYHWSVEKFETLGQLPNCHISVMTRSGDSYKLDEPFSEIKVFKEDSK